jgi:hypothetical protein
MDVLQDAEDMVDYYSPASIAQLRQESLDLMASGHYVEAIVAIQQLQGYTSRSRCQFPRANGKPTLADRVLHCAQSTRRG